jgi:hypothetical protein
MSDPETSGTDKLAMKVAKVMSAIDSVPKNGRNDYHNYDYSTDDDVMQSVRPVMAEHNLIALPSVVDRSTQRVSTGEEESDYQLHTQVTLEITLVDGDSGQTKTMRWQGEAQDGQDKGLYKALTSAMKYWALKTFLLSADADVETHDAAADHPRSNGSVSQEPTEAQIQYAQDLAQNGVWTNGERQQLLSERIPNANKNELSDLIDHMSKVVENGREVLN